MTGIRSIVIVPRDGGPKSLVVHVLVDNVIVIEIPGPFIATLYDALTRVRAEYPDLCGAHEPTEPERYVINNPGGDPSLN